jgi:hypothetical protein
MKVPNPVDCCNVRVVEPKGMLSRALLPDDPMATTLLLESPPSLALWLGGGETP